MTTAAASGETVRALAHACSPRSLRLRFFLPRDPDPEDVLARYWRFLLGAPPWGRSVVALMGGVPVGLLNLVAAGDGLVEAGLLVADTWQRQGIATHLLTTELTRRRWAGWTVRATVQPDNLAMQALLQRQRLGPCRLVSADRDQLDYDIVLPALA